MTKSLIQLLEIMTEQMSAQPLINLIDRRRGLSRKERAHTGRLQHIHKQQMLTGHRFCGANKIFRKDWIVQSSKKNKQRPPAQTQPQKGAELFEIRRNDAGLQP